LPMQFVSSGVNSKNDTFEPLKTGLNKEKSRAFGSANPTWLPIQIPLKLLKLSCRI